jgi:hypothetical protein
MTQDASIVSPPLDPGLRRVIRASADRLIAVEEPFIRQLQYELATLVPDLARLRAEDGWVFCERMARTLLWAAVTDQPRDVIADTLRQLGARNWQDGFSETQYVSVAHALVRAVRDLSADDWSASMSSAWISYFMWVKPHLIFGAQQAAGRPSTGQHAVRDGAADAAGAVGSVGQTTGQHAVVRDAAAGYTTGQHAAVRDTPAGAGGAMGQTTGQHAVVRDAPVGQTTGQHAVMRDAPVGQTTGQHPAIRQGAGGQAADHAQTAARGSWRTQPAAPAGDVDLESIAGLLEDEDERWLRQISRFDDR